MKILCVIPSRIGSTRLPRKPLLPLAGKPMVQWVYENAKKCQVITKVVVATDSDEIATVINRCGGEAIMTSSALTTGSDRVAVVAQQFPDMDIVINLQGDEPFIKPSMLEELVAPYLKGETPDMTTLANQLDMTKEYHDPRYVTAITALNGNALYFSRSPIPYFRQNPEMTMPTYHHIGLYAFRRDFLLKFTTLPQTPLEQAESLEQLRALEHGHTIRVCITKEQTVEINDLQDYEEAQRFAAQIANETKSTHGQ